MIFYRWHPEVAIRYLPIVAEIKKLGNPTILEVGSGGLGVTPYLGRKVTGLDTKFSSPIHPLLETKIGSGTKILFPDKSFDVVISVDTLEHVSPAKRSLVISEMLRVARKEVIIAAPTGEQSETQDRELAAAYQKIHGRPYPFLEEQIGFGLPTEKEIKQAMGDSVRVEKNESLGLRNFLMRGWMTKNFLAKIFYWKILLLALPLFKFFNSPPYYRTIFYKKI